MRTAKLSLTVLIIGLLGYLWVALKEVAPMTTPSVTAEIHHSERTGDTEKMDKDAPVSNVQLRTLREGKVISPVEDDDPWRSRANFEEVEKWKLSRGYYSLEDLAMYSTYSQETIEKLAESGDIKAIYTLVDIRVAQGATQQEAIDLYMRAAMFGSSQALDWAGSMALTDRNMSKFQGENGAELYKKEMMEALSIYQVALIRGDREVIERVADARSRVELTAEDLKQIEKRAADIYADLTAQRESLGLGPFDNSVPKIVQNYQDEAITGFSRFIKD